MRHDERWLGSTHMDEIAQLPVVLLRVRLAGSYALESACYQ